jgi:ribose-phosphate pyrophosphokinase
VRVRLFLTTANVTLQAENFLNFVTYHRTTFGRLVGWYFIFKDKQFLNPPDLLPTLEISTPVSTYKMVRNIVILGGSSHPKLTEAICNHLGVPPARILLGKFAVGETRVEIQESVRGKDVYIIQSGGGKVNDHLMELLITISACKIASATRITAVLPLFPYSRQSDIPYNKAGAPAMRWTQTQKGVMTSFDSRPQTPYTGPTDSKDLPNGVNGLTQQVSKLKLDQGPNGTANGKVHGNGNSTSYGTTKNAHFEDDKASTKSTTNSESSGYFSKDAALHAKRQQPPEFEAQRGYRQWVAQAGKLVADLLACAGTDHVITMDLHDPQYQGFFDIPVDNLYSRQMLKRYVQYQIPNHQQAVIVSPDAGGAKRATAIADQLGMPFALIHKVSSAHV